MSRSDAEVEIAITAILVRVTDRYQKKMGQFDDALRQDDIVRDIHTAWELWSEGAHGPALAAVEEAAASALLLATSMDIAMSINNEPDGRPN